MLKTKFENNHLDLSGDFSTVDCDNISYINTRYSIRNQNTFGVNKALEINPNQNINFNSSEIFSEIFNENFYGEKENFKSSEIIFYTQFNKKYDSENSNLFDELGFKPNDKAEETISDYTSCLDEKETFAL